MAILLADSGATKCEWFLAESKESTKTVFTQGISPYFFNEEKTVALLQQELLPQLPKTATIEEIHYYGTGMRNPVNVDMIRKSLAAVFEKAGTIEVSDDMLAAARALNGRKEGLACTWARGLLPFTTMVITLPNRRRALGTFWVTKQVAPTWEKKYFSIICTIRSMKSCVTGLTQNIIQHPLKY